MKRKIAYLGLLAALAFVFSYLETLIPIPIGIPGVKIGLANIVVVIALYQMGGKEAFLLTVGKVLLVGAVFGSLTSILYSLAGALCSFIGMYVLKKLDKFSVIGISLVGGVLHNLGQMLIASIILKSIGVFYYYPLLMLSGLLTGILIGIISNEIIKRLQMC